MKTLRSANGRLAPILFAVVGLSIGLSFAARAKTYRRQATALFEINYGKIRSRLKTTERNGEFQTVFDFADIARPDQVLGCPLQYNAKDLRSAITELVLRVSETVRTNKDENNPACERLAGQLDSSREELLNTINMTYVASAEDLNEQQMKVNDATRQASAVSSFVATTSDVIEGRCISKADSRKTIQRISGQIVTLGGLILGGWPGLAAAGAGNILGRLPLFKSDIEQAQAAIAHYDSRNNRADFLCLYREMQKTSCMVFSATDHHVFYGNDLKFATNPTRDVMATANALMKSDPTLYEEIVFLQRITFNRAEKTAAFEDLGKSCEKAGDGLFAKTPDERHPATVVEAYARHRKVCADVADLRFPEPDAEKKYMDYARWNLRTLAGYFTRLKLGKGDVNKTVAEATATYASLIYFQEMAAGLRKMRDPSNANFDRVEFGKLVNALGKRGQYAEKSFEAIEKDVRKNFESSNLKASDGVAAGGIRAAGLRAWLDLCQMSDPTLTCLYPADPEKSEYFQTWKESCVGPESRLCKSSRKHDGVALLENAHNYRAYLESLCAVEAEKR